MKIDFSAVITTLGQRDLRPLLSSIAAQTLQVLEVIVVDQSADGVLQPVLKEFEDRLTLKHISCAERGASRGRNAGIAVASAEFIFFPDDDCWYPADFCERIGEELKKGYKLVTGRTLPSPEATTTRMSKFMAEETQITLENVLYCAIEFCMAVERRIAQAIRFDPRIGVGSGTAVGSDEAIDFVVRTLQTGAPAIFSPHIVAYHPDPVAQRGPQLQNRARQYAQGRGYILRRHPIPAKIIIREVIRPAGGMILSFLRGDWFMARYYMNVFLGKIHGLFIVLAPLGQH